MNPKNNVVKVIKTKKGTIKLMTYSDFFKEFVVVLCTPYGFIIRNALLDSKNVRKVVTQGKRRFISTQLPITPGEYPYEIDGDDFIVTAPITSRC